jgi:capsular exopolysaccharide synthesis family protein
VRSVDVNTNIDQEMVSIMQNATAPVPLKTDMSKGVATGVLSGLIVGLVMLFILDRMDDRINSFTELRDHFDEAVFGQIPLEREGVAPGKGLLTPDDPRHGYAESFRNIRSSLLFMPPSQHRPKTILITSAVPSEGKSTVATNFAITMAFAGSRILLVDADLRRGIIHDAFGLVPSPGFAEVLHGDINWRQAVQATSYTNLYVLPHGKMTPQPGELFLQTSTAALWAEMGVDLDYVIIDSAPILATDDTPSLAPQIDGTLFVVRSAFTSARLTKNALDCLYQRQVNVLGLIFNGVDTSLPEYSYYKYKQYYAT